MWSLPTQSPDDYLDHVFDFSGELSSGDAIIQASVVLSTLPPGLQVRAIAVSGASVTVRVGPGTAETVYSIQCTAMSAAGRAVALSRRIYIGPVGLDLEMATIVPPGDQSVALPPLPAATIVRGPEGPPGPPGFNSVRRVPFVGVGAGQSVTLPVAFAGALALLIVQGLIENVVNYAVSGTTLTIPPGLVWDGADCTFLYI
jgi:hypothetical protein